METTIRIYYRSLPEAAHGVSAKVSDTNYIVLINSDLPEEIQSEALEPELLHIRKRDFDRTQISLDQREYEVRTEIQSNRKEA